MIEFAKEESYEVRVVNGDEYDYEVAGKLAKDEDGVWHFNYGDQSIAYEDSLEETTDQLKEVFENGKNDDMALSFGSYNYQK